MIITIDTTKDSPEDIRKAISLLQQIAHGSLNNGSNTSYSHNPPVNSAFDFSTPSPSSQNTSAPADNGFAAMFGDMGSSQVQVTSSLSNQPLSNVAANGTVSVPKKKEKYDFETY